MAAAGTRRAWRAVAGALLSAALVAGCSSDDDASTSPSSVDATGRSTDDGSAAPGSADGRGPSTTGRAGASTTTSTTTSTTGTPTSSSVPAASSSTAGTAPAATAPGSTATAGSTVTPATQPPTAATTVPPTPPPTPAPIATPPPPATDSVVAAEPAVLPTDPTTTLGPVAPTLELRADGIGPVAFGQPAEAVLATLAPQFGAVASDTTTSYPTSMGDGTYASEDGTAFPAILGRFVCFDNQLCLNFGGDDEAALVWLGWTLYGDGAESAGPVLATAQGVRPGVTWASVASLITVEPDGCYTVGYGRTGDIGLELLSPDAWFGTMGSPEPAEDTTPDPAEVVIISMSAGAQDVFLSGDC